MKQPFQISLFVAKIFVFLFTTQTLLTLSLVRLNHETWVLWLNCLAAFGGVIVTWLVCQMGFFGYEAKDDKDFDLIFQVWVFRKNVYWAAFGTFLVSSLAAYVVAYRHESVDAWRLWFGLCTLIAMLAPIISSAGRSVKTHHLPRRALGLHEFEYVILELIGGRKYFLLSRNGYSKVIPLGEVAPENLLVSAKPTKERNQYEIEVTHLETNTQVVLSFF